QVIVGDTPCIHPQAQALVPDELHNPDSFINGLILLGAAIELVLLNKDAVQRSPLAPAHAALATWRYAVAACDPAWDDSVQDTFRTARQTGWKLAVPGHVRAARPPRASLLQTDFRVWSSYGDASIQKAACRLVHTCERFVHSCPLVPLLHAGNCLCFVQTYTT